MWGAHKADGRIAAKNAVKIRAALRQSIDPREVFERYQETHPFVTDNITQDRARARAWAMMNVKINSEPMLDVLKKVYADGYVLGQVSANEALAKAEKNVQKSANYVQKSDQDLVDWATWTPGDRAASLLLRPTGAFEKLLSGAGIVSRSIEKAGYDRIGTALADSIAAGFGPAKAAKVLTEKIGDPARALTIAITEQNRAISFATVERYKDAGVEKMEWSGANPCDICAPNEGQVVAIGESFESGDDQPPVHPNCRCALLPVIDEAYFAEPDTSGVDDIMPSEEAAPEANALISDADFDSKIEELLRLNPRVQDVKDLRHVLYSREAAYKIMKDRLIDQFVAEGMGPGNAKIQAEANLTRVQFYLANLQKKESWENEVLKYQTDPQYKNDPDYLRFANQMITGRQQAEQFVAEAMKTGNVTIAINAKSLESVIADGRIKSQFETKKSGGLLSPSVRKEGEAIAIGTPVDTKPKERPIYGYITTNNDAKLGWREVTDAIKNDFSSGNATSWRQTLSLNSHQADQYGEIRLVLKNSVRDNTTVTIGDSLREGNLAENINTPNPNLTQMGLYINGAPSHMGGQNITDYVEAQVFGGVKVTDIKEIHVLGEKIVGGVRVHGSQKPQVESWLAAAGYDIPVIERNP